MTNMDLKIVQSWFLGVLVLTLGKSTEAWWLLAMPSAYEMALRLKPEDYKTHCHRLDYLVPKQKQLCALSNNMLAVVSQGAQLGLKECQVQFAGRHWNCSLIDNNLPVDILASKPAPLKTRKRKIKSKSSKIQPSKDRMMSDSPAHDLADIFGSILKINSREKAYVHAVSAAGVAYRITRACTMGELKSCGCDTKVHLKPKPKGQRNEAWNWGGCSEDLTYGDWLSKNFVDSNDIQRENGHAANKLMNLHNNAAGRMAVRSNTKLSCKCHGVSGSCTTRICWKRMKDFNKIGKTLYRKFDGAVQMTFDDKQQKLVPTIEGHRNPKKRDLVYLDASPDYCKENSALGILGTTGRRCYKNSNGMDNCMVLCCGRGYWTKIEVESYDCDCKFQWCCEVRCRKCTRRIEFNICR